MFALFFIPWIWQIALLVLAPIVGFAIGTWAAKSKHPIALWFGYTLTYSIFAVLVVFLFIAHGFGRFYNMGAWSLQVIPVLLYALPAVGLPWLLARKLVRSRISHEHEDNVEAGSAVGLVLLVVGALILAVVALVVLQNTPISVSQSTYVIPPINPTQAPQDLTEITNGSDWSCIVLREGKPTHLADDYHFGALDAGARWEDFSHHDELRPFFDLDHAKGVEQFFSGSYSVVDNKLQLSSDYAGMPLASAHQFSKNDQEAMLARHDPHLHGTISVQPNAWKGTFETISIRSLSSTTMSIVVEVNSNGPHSIELSCHRVHDPDYHPIIAPSS